MSAILTGAIRVLEEDGAELTTTRVAKVTGVSVGTLYQYFPNREALFTALLADHLEHAVGAIEAEVKATKGKPLEVATDRVVRGFLAAKARNAGNSRLLDRVFGRGILDDRPVVEVAVERARAIIAQMVCDPPDAHALRTAGDLCAALEGIVRTALREEPGRLSDHLWCDRVVAMSIAAMTSR